MNATGLERLRADLAASQAREKAMRDALEWYAMSEDGSRRFAGLKAAKALALPADDTALRAALAQAQEEMRERCAKKCEDDMYYEIGGACAEAIRALEVKP